MPEAKSSQKYRPVVGQTQPVLAVALLLDEAALDEELDATELGTLEDTALDITELDATTLDAIELAELDDTTTTTSELTELEDTMLDDATLELDRLDDATLATAELKELDALDATELTALDETELTATELAALDELLELGLSPELELPPQATKVLVATNKARY